MRTGNVVQVRYMEELRRQFQQLLAVDVHQRRILYDTADVARYGGSDGRDLRCPSLVP